MPQADIWNLVNRTRSGYIKFVRNRAKKALDESLKPIIDKLPNIREIDDSLIDNISDLPIKKLLIDVYFIVGKTFAKAVWKSLLKADFSDDVYLAQVNQIIEAEAAILIKGMNETSKATVRRIIQNEISRGLSVQEAGQNILTRLNTINRARAMSIARTETIRASNIGAMRGAYMTGLNLKKEWIPTLDERTRVEPFDHASMINVKVDMNSPFNVSGEDLDYPLDFNGSAGNTINCRCSVAFIRE